MGSKLLWWIRVVPVAAYLAVQEKWQEKQVLRSGVLVSVLAVGLRLVVVFFCRKDVQFSEQFGRGFSPSGSVDVEHPEQVDTANIHLLYN